MDLSPSSRLGWLSSILLPPYFVTYCGGWRRYCCKSFYNKGCLICSDQVVCKIMGRFFFFLFWRGEALLGLSLFVCLFLYFSGPKKLLLGTVLSNLLLWSKSNGSPIVGVILVFTLLEYDQYDQKERKHIPKLSLT